MISICTDMIKKYKKQLHDNDYDEANDSNSLNPLEKVSEKIRPTLNKRIIKDDEVYGLLLDIPLGRVSTYGDIAKILGNPSASRVIGNILGKNPYPVKVPCHRVVLSNGKLGGYIHGVEKKRELLKEEGISFKNDMTICNFEKVRFYPNYKR